MNGPAHPGPVLDASALLAWLQDEPGAERVAEALAGASMSAVNWSEVVQKTLQRGGDAEGLREEVEAMGMVIVSFGPQDAEDAARLFLVTKRQGLSLGDRACLALGAALGALVLTTDRRWVGLGEKAKVEAIR